MVRVSKKEALEMLKEASIYELGKAADEIRKKIHPEGIVTFVVDRNINYTNICINRCKFCAFWRPEGHPEAYVITKQELAKKIQETVEKGGTQILLQGGVHPKLGLDFYIDMLKFIKNNFKIHVHGFSPPEISFLSRKEGLSIKEVLEKLRQAGLDSIPGGGAEILSDRVRQLQSPNKIKTAEWLEVMRRAHLIGMKTSATMMFGSIDTEEDIVEHLDAIRRLQDETSGFTAFIPWSFQPGNTELKKENPELMPSGAVKYLRVLALSRIYLDNFPNIQVSWVTQGIKIAQVGLRFGANDFGSTMLEENVVRAAGVCYRVSMEEIIEAIKASGFRPAQRDTYYNILRFFNFKTFIVGGKNDRNL
ncbi:cyclic dehypoxanthinyl futalosine synthase [Thermodesulfovibrio aggregans]|uniref:Cyclic dehypoxanthine futalosine synthase n=1 Tax=Thermodesulfovibrio aggregans TaxID=86166 RepID=A0A0U9HM71_9BACT|nr:cyclic dehypoxanthinyl futalosine synthase [Thermodesulfovibrio aggregans]GAQ94172.1 cyclic dehypoxanthinyl futalosine synthase [Thermodesulfovibrio aggregans]